MSTFPSAPDNIAPLNVTNATAERDVHPLLHNQLASAVNAIETYLLPGGGFATADPLKLGNGSPSAPTYSFLAQPTTGLYFGSDSLRFSVGGNEELLLNQYGLSVSSELDVGGSTRLRGTLFFEYDNVHDIGLVASNRVRNIYVGTSVDTPVITSPTNVIEQRNGANAQSFLLYNKYTDAANNERLRLSWTSNVAYLTTEWLGSGAGRQLTIGTEANTALNFRTNAINKWTIIAGGSFTALTDNVYDIGNAGNFRPRTIYAGTSVVAPLFNTPHRTAPASPVNGDIWTTTAGIFVRINGVTRELFLV